MNFDKENFTLISLFCAHTFALEYGAECILPRTGYRRALV